MHEKLYDTREAAEMLGVSPRTLESWRIHGGGPRFASFGAGPRGAVRYRASDLEEYINGRLRTSTSAPAGGVA